MKTKGTSRGGADDAPRSGEAATARRRLTSSGTKLLDGKRVLIVDDSPAVRSFAKVKLMSHRVEFIEADSGDRALRILRVLPVDVVLADVNMPGTDGISLVRQLRASEQQTLRRIPVILMSSDATDALRAAAMEAGAQAFLRKPFTDDALAAIIVELFPEGE